MSLTNVGLILPKKKIQCLCVYLLQLLLFLKGFTESERNKLAMLTGILLANGNISASILSSLFNENLVKEGRQCHSVAADGIRLTKLL